MVLQNITCRSISKIIVLMLFALVFAGVWFVSICLRITHSQAAVLSLRHLNWFFVYVCETSAGYEYRSEFCMIVSINMAVLIKQLFHTD